VSEHKILLVSNGDLVRTGVGKELKTQGYGVTAVNSGKKALKLLKKETYDLAIIDSIEDGIDSFKVVKDIKEVSPETLAIILTANRDADFVIEAFRLGVDDCLLKPFKKEDLFLRIKRCLGKHRKKELKKKNKEAEETISRDELIFRELVNNMSSCVAVYEAIEEGKDFIIKDMNKSGEQSSRVSRDEIIGRAVTEVFPGVKEMGLLAVFKRVWETGKSEHHPVSMYKDDRISLWVENYVYKISTSEIVAVYSDISEQKRAEEELKQSEERLRIMFEFAPDAYYISDKKGIFLDANKAAEDMVGWKKEELIGKSFLKLNLLPFNQIPKAADLLVQSALKKSTGPDEFTLIRKDGSRVIVEISTYPIVLADKIMVLGIARDITARKKAEEALQESEAKLAHSQKMEAVGRLAGGIAHDFNNLLTTILGYSDMILLEQNLDDDLIESVKEIKASSKRAAALTQQLLAFSRKQVLRPEVIDLNDLITNLSKMLGRLIGEDIELIIKPGTDPCRIKADPGQIEQIIMNLAVNARDAMRKGGKLAIETQSIYLDKSYRQDYPEIIPGYYVLLAVSDTGRGMDEETRKQIFDPFFTTKEVGKGTGLGSSTVYGIVKQSGGYVWAYSEPDHGTTFKIYLPQIEVETEKQQKGLADKQEPMGGTETILLVEDEESLRKMAGKILEGYGYAVVEATDGMEALEIVNKEDHPEIDLLVTDVIMPKMGGKELAGKLTEEYPKLKVLYISGYTDNAIAHHGVLDEGVSLLSKPFSLQSLAKKVREVLDKSQD